jgi:mycofactocin precursor
MYDPSMSTAAEGVANDSSEEPAPSIEEQLISEELRIDGICGVY